MTTATKIIQTYYVSTGKKNAMYTLRFRRDWIGQPGYMFDLMPDHYVCNLAADESRAMEKAADFVDAFRARVGETDDFRIVFDNSGADREAYKRRGKLSVQDTMKIERIEAGVIPFGKHADKLFSDAPDSWILYWVDKSREPIDSPVIGAIMAVCQGIAAEKGLIAKRQEQREARHAVDMQSSHVGTVGKRQDFTGVLEYLSAPQMGTYGEWHTNKVRCGNDLVIYFGAPLGKQGETVSFRATVKKHDEREGVKTTQVNRPTK
jgi:uncharacterized protein (DUF3820 family)